MAMPLPSDNRHGAAPAASVIIPTKNGARRLPSVLEVLQRTAPEADAEVIVVDDCSTDDTSAVAKRYGARVIKSDTPLGASAATALGIKHARADVIGLTDDDTVPAEDWVSRGIEAVRTSRTGLIGGRIDVPIGENPTIAELVDVGRGYLDQKAHVEDGFAATANFWASREALDAVGSFRSDFRAQVHDRDFGERARLAGIPIQYADAVVVSHPPRDNIRALARKEYRLGYGEAELRARSVGEITRRPYTWRVLKYYRPWLRIWGLDRVRAAGHAPNLRERLAMRLVQYTCVQLALAVGSFSGTLGEFRRVRSSL